MAISILQECSPLQPAYNELIHVINSTNRAQTNFKYICDIYVNGVLLPRIDTPPHPTYGTGTFNPARIIEAYVNSDIDLTTYGFGVNTNSNCYYQLKFGEQYGASSSGSTAYPNMAVTGNKYVWNSIYDYEDFVGYSSGTINAGSSSSRFLTNAPSSGDIQFTENAYLYANTLTSGNIDYASILTYSGGVLRTTTKVNNQYKAFPTSSARFLRFSSAPNNINQILPANITSGSQPIILSTDGYYTIQYFNASNVAVTEKYQYTINSPCSKYTSYRLHFLNKLGGYDSFTFFKQNTFTSDIKRDNFKANLGAYGATSYTYTAQQRAITQFNTKIKDTISVNSDWVSEAQMLWLEELLTSPDVYVEKNGGLVPINLTDSSHERKLQVNKHLFNLKISFQYSYERQRQRF